MHDTIQIIPSDKIDQAKWNACIEQSASHLIYAKTFYLDYLADQWHGFVIGDYECVMPVPWRKKYSIRYTYQVPFIQQLGIFGKQSKPDESQLLQALQQFCTYGDYVFNFCNGSPTKDCILKNNFILELSSYRFISENYSPDLRQNLKKACNQILNYKYISHEKAIDIFYELYHIKTPHVPKENYSKFKKLCDHLNISGNVHCREVINAKNETAAIALFLQDGNRIYNMMNSTPVAGRKISANHFLMDKVLEEFCGKNLVFDFEGSDIPGIKSFYENFGATLQPYASLHYNKLRGPLKYFK
ncbi:MAG: hypothetical protein ABIY35_01175 [Chitinophagaceae bacterium]